MKKKEVLTLDEEIVKEFNYINNGINNFDNQDFKDKHRIHDWKNYVEDIYIRHWNELTEREKKIIFISCKVQSDEEYWD